MKEGLGEGLEGGGATGGGEPEKALATPPTSDAADREVEPLSGMASVDAHKPRAPTVVDRGESNSDVNGSNSDDDINGSNADVAGGGASMYDRLLRHATQQADKAAARLDASGHSDQKDASDHSGQKDASYASGQKFAGTGTGKPRGVHVLQEGSREDARAVVVQDTKVVHEEGSGGQRGAWWEAGEDAEDEDEDEKDHTDEWLSESVMRGYAPMRGYRPPLPLYLQAWLFKRLPRSSENALS